MKYLITAIRTAKYSLVREMSDIVFLLPGLLKVDVGYMHVVPSPTPKHHVHHSSLSRVGSPATIKCPLIRIIYFERLL